VKKTFDFCIAFNLFSYKVNNKKREFKAPLQ